MSKKSNVSIDDARKQLVAYGSQIQEYLGQIGANVENYKFSIEKTKEGIIVDVAFRASVKIKDS